MDEKIVTFLEENGYKVSTILLVAFVLYLVANVESVMIFKSWLYGLGSNFFSFAKKRQISNKVRGTIIKSVKDQALTDDSIMPADLKVIWVNEEKTETFVQNNQVIVRIKQSSNPHENLVTAVSEYVNSGLLCNVKRYLNKEVMNASRILMTRKVIQSASKTSLTYLDENYIIPQLENNEDLKELYEDLVKIDNNGMFVGIMLNEFNKAGMSIYNEIEDPELVAESKEFMRYLYNIAIRITNDYSELCFNRDYFKVAIFLTASNKTLKRAGTAPFVKAISNALTNGIETVYIFGLGSKMEVADKISKEVTGDYRINRIIKHPYRHVNENGRRIPGVFYECEIYKEETSE